MARWPGAMNFWAGPWTLKSWWPWWPSTFLRGDLIISLLTELISKYQAAGVRSSDTDKHDKLPRTAFKRFKRLCGETNHQYSWFYSQFIPYKHHYRYWQEEGIIQGYCPGTWGEADRTARAIRRFYMPRYNCILVVALFSYPQQTGEQTDNLVSNLV